jgi:hypothetical protein
MIQIAQEDSMKEELTKESFGAWQITETVKGLFSGKGFKGTIFSDYVKRLGLIEKVEEENDIFKKIQRKQEVEKALQTAKEIIELEWGDKKND